MTRTKLVSMTLILILILFSIICFGSISSAYAETVVVENSEIKVNGDEEAVPYGLFTNLTLSIDGGNGQVWATAKNKFTMFSSSIPVVVEIYSSDTYQESYTNMTLESRNYINNLKMGQTVTATASTNGQQKYWKGRMYFNIDNKGWDEEVTSTWLCDANGFPVL